MAIRARRKGSWTLWALPPRTELILDLVRNAANKIAVVFDADEPQVETGVEYYAIDVSTGELRYDVSPVTPKAEQPAGDELRPPRTE